MGTRAAIRVVDANRETLYFYQHSDGYPEGTLPLLNKLMEDVKSGKLRDNTMQFAGWLIRSSIAEYVTGQDWKSSYIEPATAKIWSKDGDREYFYTVNLTKRTVTYT